MLSVFFEGTLTKDFSYMILDATTIDSSNYCEYQQNLRSNIIIVSGKIQESYLRSTSSGLFIMYSAN
jgi:hypothetical protein